MKKFDIGFGLIKVPLDFLMAWGAFLLAYFLRKSGFFGLLPPVIDFEVYKTFDEYFVWSLVLCTALVGVMAFRKVYSFKFRPLSVQVRNILESCLLWLGLLIVFYFFRRAFPFSRFVVLSTAGFSFVAVVTGRYFLDRFRLFLNRRGYGLRKVVLVAQTREVLEQVLKSLKYDDRYEVVGYLSDKSFRFGGMKVKRLGNIASVAEVLRNAGFDELIQIGVCKKTSLNEEILNLCRYHRIDYSYLPELFEIRRHNVSMNQIGNLPLFNMERTRLRGWGRVVKRGFDFVFGLVGLILLSPILLVIAVAIKLEDPKGDIFWKYLDDGETVVKRVGYEKKPFYCFKFRTMKPNSHMQRYNELADKDIRGDELVKIADDPRVTKVGRILRRFDLDELPQLFNVVKGDMSLVGPRPHLPEEVARYKEHHNFVFNIKPGVTGMAQVNGRSDLSFENEVKLDSYYIENWSLWLDIKVILKTILVIFERHGENKE